MKCNIQKPFVAKPTFEYYFTETASGIEVKQDFKVESGLVDAFFMWLFGAKAGMEKMNQTGLDLMKKQLNLKTKTMDKTVKTMMESLKEKTGHTLEEWKKLISARKISKHGEMVKFLKEQHHVTHGYASEIALKVLGSDADSSDNTDELIVSQYKGKEHLKPFYDKLILEIKNLKVTLKLRPKNLC